MGALSVILVYFLIHLWAKNKIKETQQHQATTYTFFEICSVCCIFMPIFFTGVSFQDAAFVSQKLFLWSHRQLWQPLSRNELA